MREDTASRSWMDRLLHFDGIVIDWYVGNVASLPRYFVDVTQKNGAASAAGIADKLQQWNRAEELR